MSEEATTYNKPAVDPASMSESTPKATLEFPLPEYQQEFLQAAFAKDLVGTLWDIDQELRAHLKYDGKATADELAQKVRDMIAEVYHLIF